MKSLIKLCLGAAVAVSLSTAAVAGPFTQTDQCSSCAMVIKKYPGPKGLLVLKDKSVQKFCSARGTACGYAAAMKKTGVVHVFMHDAGAVDWKNPDDSKLIDATKAWFVYGSKVKAVMGPSLASFATKEAAQAFQKANGGKLMSFADLTPEALGCGEKY